VGCQYGAKKRCERPVVDAGPGHDDACLLHLRQRHPRIAAAWKRTNEQNSGAVAVHGSSGGPVVSGEDGAVRQVLLPSHPAAGGGLLGKTEPRLFTAPLRPLTRETTWGFAVSDFADMIGHPLLPWQREAAVRGLELRPPFTTADAGWLVRFRTVLVLVARQNGKSDLDRIIKLFKLFVLRVLLVVGTAQDVTIALRMLEATNNLVDACPALEAERVAFRRGNGKESLTLTGSREYIIRAANEDAARSLTIDHLSVDELRTHTSWGPWAALSKAQNAVANGQAWLFSNAGGEEAIVLNQIRSNAINGKTPSLCLLEWSAADGCELDDREAWAQANPSLGYLISEDAIQSSLDTDPPAIFRTEVLCQAVASLDGAVDLAAWRSASDATGNGLADAERICLCLDVSPEDGSVILLGGAPMPDGRTRVQVLKTWPDIMAALAGVPAIDAAVKPERFGWFPSGPAAAMASALRSMDGSSIGVSAASVCANKLCEHRVRPGIAYCCAPCATAGEGHYEIHESGPLGHTDQCLARQIRPPRVTPRSEFELVELTGADVTEACQEFAALVAAGQVVHAGDKVLDGHIAGAKKWNSGDGWRFVRRGQGNVHGAYAAAGAVRLARNLPPPRKRMKMVV
jgi:hypothetical protein